MTVAALYVETGGAYFGLAGVDPWDQPRDARKYAGPWPVVAHPPCDRWCQMAPVNQARYGHKVGDDLLIAVARRLQQRLRNEDTLARLSSDEFLVVLENLHAGLSV